MMSVKYQRNCEVLAPPIVIKGFFFEGLVCRQFSAGGISFLLFETQQRLVVISYVDI